MGESVAPRAPAVPVDVLVIDDSELIRRATERLLTTAGLSVLTLSSLAGALPEIVRRQVRLVVVDLHIPGTDCDQLASFLRQARTFDDLRVVILSGLPEADLERAAAKLGADAAAAKGTPPKEIVALVRHLLGADH